VLSKYNNFENSGGPNDRFFLRIGYLRSVFVDRRILPNMWFNGAGFWFGSKHFFVYWLFSRTISDPQKSVSGFCFVDRRIVQICGSMARGYVLEANIFLCIGYLRLVFF